MARIRLSIIFAIIAVSAIIPAFLPGQEDSAARAQSVSNAIARLLGSSAVAGGAMSVEFRDLQTGETIFSRNADKLMIPASNMKIITTAAVLSKLGPGYRFPTEVYVDGPIKGGVLDGNMYLKGYGDPSMVDEKLWTLARDIAYRGIIEIKGKIFADDTYFDRNMHGEDWGDIGTDPYFAPICALSLNFNTFVVTANPAAAGNPPKLFYMAPDRHLKLVNRAMTVGGGGRKLLRVVAMDKETNSFEIIGTIPVGSKTEELRRTINDPALYTVGSFEAYLISWGVVVSGEIGRNAVPKEARLFHRTESHQLSRILWDSGKMSNNFVTEQMLKVLCAQKGPEGSRIPATTKCGIDVLKEFLGELGVPAESYVITDGSGLSRTNRLAAKTINNVLDAMYKNKYLWPEFAACLSIAGIDGTLEDRFESSPLKGKVRAKTGHLNGVNSLSGYLPTENGGMIAFSMIFNNFPGINPSVEMVEENILEAAAKY